MCLVSRELFSISVTLRKETAGLRSEEGPEPAVGAAKGCRGGFRIESIKMPFMIRLISLFLGPGLARLNQNIYRMDAMETHITV